MKRVVRTATVARADLDGILATREGVSAEVNLGGGRYGLAPGGGPFREYRRTVVVEHLPDGERVHITQTVDFSLAIPYFGWLFVLPISRRLARIGPTAAGFPWWSPPARLDARAASALGTLAGASVVAGYLNTLLTQTITFAADEFGAGNRAQGFAGGAVRVGGMFAFAIVALADRRGRRQLVLITAVASIVASVTGAFAPSLFWLTATQFVGRPFASALLVVIGILVVEEMPAGARAYAVSVLAMATALGAGTCVLALPLADLGTRGWRLVYVIPVFGLFLVRGLARNLQESKRFQLRHAEVSMAGHGRRFWLLAASVLLSGLFVAPASFFQNRYLDVERGFSAARISMLTILTNTPGGIGIVLGGRLSETRGRRIIGAVGLLGGTIGTALVFRSTGWTLWAWSVSAAVIGAMAVPALGVYGPELFPTSLRGRANGLLTTAGLVGSLAGLLLVGWLSDSLGNFGTPMTIMAFGPVSVAVLVLTLYPETAHLELEEINPEDALDGTPDAPA